MNPGTRFLSRSALASLLNLSPRTLETWARTGYGPRAVRIGRRRIGYPTAGVARWLKANARPIGRTRTEGGVR